jgi:hypothetical protein
MATSAAVTIDIDHKVATIRPGDVAPLLAADLTYAPTSFLAGGPLGYRRVKGVERLYRLGADGALVVPAGLAAFAADRLRRAGVAVAVHDRRVFGPRAQPDARALRALAGPDRALLDALAEPDRALLGALAREPRGLIEVAGSADAAHTAALICRLFPLARVMARLATREKVRRFRRDWEAMLRARVHTWVTYDWPWEGGRLADTMHASCDPSSLYFDVVLYADALRAATPRYTKALRWITDSRVYGLLPRGAALSASARLRLQAVFGPVIHRAADPRGLAATVRVAWCTTPWSPPPGDLAPPERKRRGYWHSEARNDLIAGVARALSAGDREALWRHGLFLDGDAAAGPAGRAVTLLVESPRHGRELLRRLPGWRLWALAPPPGPAAEVIDSDPLRARVLRDVILTWARADRLAAYEFDVQVVVRADGQPWPLAFRGFPPPCPSVGHEVLLIDVADDFDNEAREATRARQRDYAARGWPSDGLPAWLKQSV